jgi:hypothetical protein
MGLMHRWPLGARALRVAGVAVALAGLSFLSEAIA